MFFFIAGLQPKTITGPTADQQCPSCSSRSMVKKRVDQYFSVFFIPLFPVKKGDPFLACAACKEIFTLDTVPGRVRETGINCRSCGKPLNPDFSFCPFCGSRQ